MREAARHGALQGGRTLLGVKAAYDSAGSQTADKMVQLAFNLTGSTVLELAGVLGGAVATQFAQ
jgi:hypothetical protein